MATRKQVREAVIQLLYAKELGNDKAVEQAHSFFYEQKIRNKQQEFALHLLHGVCREEEYIVEIINVFLKAWDINRLGVIERNIIKLGIYELLQTNTQKGVVINEAIELTKTFNVQDAFRLVNGVLDSVATTDSKTLDELIQERKKAQENNTKKSTQDSTKEVKVKHKAASQHRQHTIKKTQLPVRRLKNVKADSIQSTQAKKTDAAHIKSVQINKNRVEQNIKQAINTNITKKDSKSIYTSVKKQHDAHKKDTRQHPRQRTHNIQKNTKVTTKRK